MKIASLVALCLLGTAPLSAPAHADIGPPRIAPRIKVPADVRIWISAATAAMKSGDLARAKELCDPRGFGDNLVGGSGGTLESIFTQGAKKGWHLALDFDDVKLLPGGRGAIAHTWVRDNATRKDLDALWILLIPSADDEGPWLALGAGEKRVEVQALADRWRAGEPLAPPAPPAPETE